MPSLIIIDTGCANLASVQYALTRLGYRPQVSADPVAIRAADKLILPGVGSAAAAMHNLAARSLIEPVRTARQPLLGICLGMQLLTGHSAEGDTATLGLIPGDTAALPGCGLPLPHTGWNTVHHQPQHPLFDGIAQDSHYYYVHGYAVPPGAHTIATSDYGVPFSAAIARDNSSGVQFHPERSGKSGARLLQNFMENL